MKDAWNLVATHPYLKQFSIEPSQPVSRILYSLLQVVAIYLGSTLLVSSRSLPGCQAERATPSILLDLAPGGACLAGNIAATAGGLLHHRFTLAN